MDSPPTPTPIKPQNKIKNNKQKKQQRLPRKEQFKQKELKIIPTSKKDNNQNNNNSPSLSFVEEEVPSVGELWSMSKKERKKLEKKNIKVKPPEQQQYVTNDKNVNKPSLDELASLDDDEELPSVEELLNGAIPPKKECEKKNNIVELLDQQQEQEQSEPELPDYDVLKDETLSIPGELVLAYSLRKYYPAKIIGYEKPGKYHVLFCDGSKTTLGRNKFYTIYEKGFVTCNLGEIVMEKEDPDYEDPELIAAILDLEPTLSDVLLGNDKLAWRYDYFVEGKKKRQLLASRVSQGPFNQSEFGLIAKVLRHMYVPDVAKAIDKKDNIVKPSELIISIMKLENKQYQKEEEEEEEEEEQEQDNRQQDNQQELSLPSTPVSTPHKHNNLTDVTSRKSLNPQPESSPSQQLTTSVSTPHKRKHLSSLLYDVTPNKHSRQQSETSSPSLAQPTAAAAAASSSSSSSPSPSPSPSSPPPPPPLPLSPSPSLSSSSSSLLYDKLKRPFFNYSSNLQLRFVNDVLIPETIIRLIMKEDGLSYKEADYKMTDGYEDLRWVETIMSSRSCFSK